MEIFPLVRQGSLAGLSFCSDLRKRDRGVERFGGIIYNENLVHDCTGEPGSCVRTKTMTEKIQDDKIHSLGCIY